MQSDLGKVFIGGISRDTDGECLKEYFSCYGEVLEAVSMRDRSTGRARGFGFVVFADPAAAQRVLQEKHIIDGRMVICRFISQFIAQLSLCCVILIPEACIHYVILQTLGSLIRSQVN